MQLMLTDDDARLLGELLRDVLPDLRREVARTDVKSLRHQLVLREELAERVLSQLQQVAPPNVPVN